MLRFLFSTSGRVSRVGVWLGLAPLQLAFAGGVAAVGAGPAPAIALFAPFGALVAWCTVAVAAKRFQDRGLSAWQGLWLLLIAATGASAALMDASRFASWGGAAAAAGAGLVAFAIVYLLPGEAEDNRFGAPAGRAKALEAASTLKSPELSPELSPRPARRAERRCKPVLQSFKGPDRRAAAMVEPLPLPPGARANFGQRGI
jgi:uncharacterized membrane protein YhaH (DUF805 family)